VRHYARRHDFPDVSRYDLYLYNSTAREAQRWQEPATCGDGRRRAWATAPSASGRPTGFQKLAVLGPSAAPHHRFCPSSPQRRPTQTLRSPPPALQPPPVASCQLPVANCQLPPATCHLPPATSPADARCCLACVLHIYTARLHVHVDSAALLRLQYTPARTSCSGWRPMASSPQASRGRAP
jgi:hypothetical protein